MPRIYLDGTINLPVIRMIGLPNQPLRQGCSVCMTAFPILPSAMPSSARPSPNAVPPARSYSTARGFAFIVLDPFPARLGRGKSADARPLPCTEARLQQNHLACRSRCSKVRIKGCLPAIMQLQAGKSGSCRSPGQPLITV